MLDHRQNDPPREMKGAGVVLCTSSLSVYKCVHLSVCPSVAFFSPSMEKRRKARMERGKLLMITHIATEEEKQVADYRNIVTRLGENS